MRTTSLLSAIEDLKKSSFNKNSLAYKSAIRLLENPKNGVVTGKEFGTGRYASSKEWSCETLAILNSLGIDAKRENLAPRGWKWGERVSLTNNQRHMFEIVDCLKTYYRLPECKRNSWRCNSAIEVAKNILERGEVVNFKGAQWGGKWGNYCRMIAMNSKGEYQYAEGFNPKKYII